MFEIDTETYSTRNYERNGDGTPQLIAPQGLLLHEGGGTQKSDLAELTGNSPSGRKVSCNYYISKLGDIFALGPDNREYWHAGAPDHNTTRWHGASPSHFGIRNGNKLIGVETEHVRGQKWQPVQRDAITWLFRTKIEAYRFPITHVGSHKQYAPSRKQDPSDWPDAELNEWYTSLYVTSGAYYVVVESLGARIRQGPSRTFPQVTTLPHGYVFWSDGEKEGENIGGEATWLHFAGPTQQIPDPLGFVFSGICQKVT